MLTQASQIQKPIQFQKPSGWLLAAQISGPVFILGLVWVLCFSRSPLSGDEPRYFAYAQNLSHGFFATPQTRLLWNGPGYPLTLVPWMLLPHREWVITAARLMNAIWLGLACFAFTSTLGLWGIRSLHKWAWGLSIYLVLHGALLEKLMSEALAAFCMAAFIWQVVLAFQSNRKLNLWYASIFAAWLMLTKVFFAYAFLVSGICWVMLTAILAFFVRSNRNVNQAQEALAVTRKVFFIGILSLIWCSPYLLYTYHLTHKFFYWGNSGGAQLYCLTTPEPHLLGDWLNSDAVIQNPEFFGTHSRLYSSIDTLDFVAQDHILKMEALRNIEAHPQKVFQNWRANLNRLVLGQPVSAYPGASPELKTGNRGMVQSFWFFVLLPTFFILVCSRVRLDTPVIGLSVMTLVSLFGLTLLSTEPRQVFPLLIPIALLGVYAFQKCLVWQWIATPGTPISLSDAP